MAYLGLGVGAALLLLGWAAASSIRRHGLRRTAAGAVRSVLEELPPEPPVSEQPEGLVYAPEQITVEEEGELLERLASLRFGPIVLHGQAAKRTARHYGLGYDYEARTPQPGEPIPDWLEPLRVRAADLSGHRPEEFVEALVQRYAPGSTIGWHRDAPAFGTVAGISLGAAARFRFQRGKGEARRVWELLVEPRSGYVLAGPARASWQHSIPPTKELRYSVTFRTLRDP